MTDMTREYVGSYGFDGEPELTGEEIVRCRDCMHFSFEYGGICKRFLRTPFIFHTEYEGFCWRGKRKEGGDD